ncbi:MAG: tRNA (adenine-N1)-methyltransferase [archaeon GB-1867-005]|nr:tRNA (adenine-N1)-methyltransferase [Candidatus Culexmicrobium cathedralense]
MHENVIHEGDYVIMYLNRRRTYLVKVKPDQVLHTHRGYVKLGELIGKRYGTKVKSHLGYTFTALKPNLKDFIFKFARKTQIIYPKDIALIIIYTGIGPGWKVVEAGTGSGALTSALAYYVKPNGKVYSYDIREEALEVARKNLEKAGLLDSVELKLKDVTQGIDERNVDAVVLDLATPWLVVPHAYEALADWGVFASYSPTIDQVVKTVEALKNEGFIAIECLECLVRRIKAVPGETRPETLMIGHTGYIVIARKSIREEID